MTFPMLNKYLACYTQSGAPEEYLPDLTEAEEYLAYKEIKDIFEYLKHAIERRVFEFAKSLAESNGEKGSWSYCDLHSITFTDNIVTVTGVHRWHGESEYCNIKFPEALITAGGGALNKYKEYLDEKIRQDQADAKVREENERIRRIQETEGREKAELLRLKQKYEQTNS